MQTEDQAEGRRTAFFDEQFALIPKSYSPIAHLSASAGVGILAITVAFAKIASFRLPLLGIAITFMVLANLVEWLSHKYFLHRRQRFLEPLYDQHVPRHHRFYTEHDMAVGSRREWRFVLMPARGVLAIAILVIPLAVAVGHLFGADYGWVTIMTIGSYTSFYEVTHLIYHLPKDHRILRLPVIGRALRWLSHHHARHHDPRLMRKWNFNVTVPLWDFILGTNHWGSKAAKEP